jgi:hypothetical protein
MRCRSGGAADFGANVSGLSDRSDIDIERAVRAARARLPRSHQGLLEQINAQDLVVGAWPAGVLDLYRTVQKRPPEEQHLRGALAVWLEDMRVVAFNGPLLRTFLDGFDNATVQHWVNQIAWHEYGHALSATRAPDDARQQGPRLLELLPDGVRRAIDYPGSYSRRQVFDEVIANLYPMMLDRAVSLNDYGRPEFLHPDVYDAFRQVLPWPPTS